ncbi:MAG: NAD(P)/FAD-dependent oxidoreductase [Bacillota bacterium]|nr:NAD(P)/FAD-dependent oxidoreductase [Bacillota bacterium]MDW7676178.1 NAD(P)/FAD-dependent oxidoreductase [Bacillota bacterium]
MTNTAYDLVIVGAGPGGMMAAVEASVRGLHVLVLEKNDQPGKKLLATGSGQCNLTHMESLKVFLSRYYEKAVFAGKTIRQFTPIDLQTWFEKAGVPLEVTNEGKVFPASRKASDVLQALLRQMNASGSQLRCGVQVQSVGFQDGHWVVAAGEKTFTADYVLIATGGKSYPSLGTTGDGYVMAKRLGHHIEPLRPSLAAVEVNHFQLSDLAGITLPSTHVTHWRGGRKRGTYCDDLLITHDGISGPVILNHVRFFMSGDVLTINLAAPLDAEMYAVQLLEKIGNSGKRLIRSTASQDNIPRRLLDRLLLLAGIPGDLTCASINRGQRRELVKLITGLPLTISRTKGYETAMATAGGVATVEVSGATMASRLVPGLYFAGEVLDVDGMTGGYNLQFAFSSGYVAAKAIHEKVAAGR